MSEISTNSGGLLVWAGIPLDVWQYIPYIFARGTATAVRSDLVVEFLESEDIHQMDWPVRYPDHLILIKLDWDALRMAIATLYPISPSIPLREMKGSLILA
ncbi:hypothetical protein TNCV_2486561 [Trichonephila clavipes]|uniref:Uncharacterized protein n=1 Tax=Trichonephila clavipes TaxID=2585209 RepID=A0A8X6W063_TRICX|nr:hypothetical protein TNCV_2486561 [Trichonephila clavipes]